MANAVLLQANDLKLRYPGAASPALNNLSLEIEQGEVFGLLGPNGAGKTTAISVMCTLLKPDAGNLMIAGKDVLKKPGEARRSIGMVPQEIALYPRLSARENLRYFGRLCGYSGPRLTGRINECLEFVGLHENADRAIATYSGGMKRRANLAAALVHEPRLLFLDEPTVGIDAQSRNQILENLALLKQQGLTMVYTTHYMEEAQLLCDRLTIIDHGRELRKGTPAELLAAEPDCRNLEDLFLRLTGRQLRD